VQGFIGALSSSSLFKGNPSEVINPGAREKELEASKVHERKKV
jgi:hypothetical protein